MVDHHLHVSGILPHIPDGQDVIYKHDWLCASQSVICNPGDKLMRAACLLDSSNQKKDTLFKSHVWVTQVGNSSLQLGNMITVDVGERKVPIAMAHRAFVRKSRQEGQVLPFSDQERLRFETECGVEESVKEIMNRPMNRPMNTQKKAKLFRDAQKSMDQEPAFTTRGKLPPLMNRLSEIQSNFTASPHLTVRVGPQHINSGNHADHAFLAETAFQVFQEEQDVDLPFFELKVTYISEALLGDTLECFVGNDNRVYMERVDCSGGPRVTVIVAECDTTSIVCY